MRFSLDEFRFPSKFIKESPHRDEPLKQKAYEILRIKYMEKCAEAHSMNGMNYTAIELEKMKWRKYLKSLGITQSKDGILDPSSEMEWHQRYLHIPEQLMNKILAIGLP